MTCSVAYGNEGKLSIFILKLRLPLAVLSRLWKERRLHVGRKEGMEEEPSGAKETLLTLPESRRVVGQPWLHQHLFMLVCGCVHALCVQFWVFHLLKQT